MISQIFFVNVFDFVIKIGKLYIPQKILIPFDIIKKSLRYHRYPGGSKKISTYVKFFVGF